MGLVAFVLLQVPAVAVGRQEAPPGVTVRAQDRTPRLDVRQLGVARNCNSKINAMGWSPDGSTLAAGYRDGKVRLWTETDLKPVTEFQAHDGDVNALVWSPDARSFATGGADGMIKVWDTASHNADRVIRTPSCYFLAWSPDGKTLASWGGGDYSIVLWSAGTWKERSRISIGSSEAHSGIATWSPDSGFLALSGGNRTWLRIWDVKNERMHGVYWSHEREFVTAMPAHWSPDGTSLAISAFQGSVVIWDVVAERVVTTLIGKKNWTCASSLAWSPKGDLIAVGYSRYTVIWDATTTAELVCIESSDRSNDFFAWRPDGKVLAIATDFAISFWQVG